MNSHQLSLEVVKLAAGSAGRPACEVGVFTLEPTDDCSLLARSHVYFRLGVEKPLVYESSFILRNRDKVWLEN